jgi:hypothetical protein
VQQGALAAAMAAALAGGGGGGGGGSEDGAGGEGDAAELGGPGPWLAADGGEDESEDESEDGSGGGSGGSSDYSDTDSQGSGALQLASGLEPSAMHCALRDHSVRLVAPLPARHAGVSARTYHHQTADAAAFVPRRGGGGGGDGGSGGGGSSGGISWGGGRGGAPTEDLLVACGTKLVLWRLEGDPAKARRGGGAPERRGRGSKSCRPTTQPLPTRGPPAPPPAPPAPTHPPLHAPP